MTRLTCTMCLALVGCGGLLNGTEIGDEGPALCIEDVVPLVDPDTALDGFSDSASALIDACEGSFDSAEASLEILAHRDDAQHADLEPAEWEDDSPPPEEWNDVECIDFVWLPADWTLTVPGVEVTWPGDLTFTADGASRGGLQALFADNPAASDPSDDEGGTDTGPVGPSGELTVDSSAEPQTFVVDDMRRVELWVRGEFDGVGWDLDLTWMAETHPEGPDGNVSSLEETVWSGRVEAPAG